MLCPHCTNELPENATTCPSCGQSVCAEAETETAKKSDVITEGAAAASPVTDPASKKSAGVNAMVWGIVGAALAAWSAAIVLAIFFRVPYISSFLLTFITAGGILRYIIPVAAFVISFVASGKIRKYCEQFGVPTSGMAHVGLILSKIARPISIVSFVMIIIDLVWSIVSTIIALAMLILFVVLYCLFLVGMIGLMA